MHTTDRMFFGVLAVVFASIPAIACGGVPAYPQPVLEDEEPDFEAPELVASKNALEADGFVCSPGTSRACARFDSAAGSCVKLAQHCASDGAGWLPCGADPNGAFDPDLFDQTDADESGCDDPGGNVIVR